MAFTTDQAFAYLKRSFDEDRLAHAYLITGREGAGKEALVLKMLSLTGGCKESRIDAVRDPHVHLVRPESRSRRIKINQIRALERQLHLSGKPGVIKVGIVREADRLQVESENAFLKTLEEPPPGTLLLLLTAEPERLLDTIRSRCIQVALYSASDHRPDYPAAFLDFVRESATALSAPKRTLSRALVLGGKFAKLLKAEKEQIAQENDAALREEIERYKETTDGDWLKQREGFYKDRTESDYVRRRTVLLEGLLAFFGDAVRWQAGYRRVDFGEFAELAEAVAGQLEPQDLNARFSALEKLRGHLETTVQDTLAIEVGFIRAFS